MSETTTAAPLANVTSAMGQHWHLDHFESRDIFEWVMGIQVCAFAIEDMDHGDDGGGDDEEENDNNDDDKEKDDKEKDDKEEDYKPRNLHWAISLQLPGQKSVSLTMARGSGPNASLGTIQVSSKPYQVPPHAMQIVVLSTNQTPGTLRVRTITELIDAYHRDTFNFAEGIDSARDWVSTVVSDLEGVGIVSRGSAAAMTWQFENGFPSSAGCPIWIAERQEHEGRQRPGPEGQPFWPDGAWTAFDDNIVSCTFNSIS